MLLPLRPCFFRSCEFAFSVWNVLSSSELFVLKEGIIWDLHRFGSAWCRMTSENAVPPVVHRRGTPRPHRKAGIELRTNRVRFSKWLCAAPAAIRSSSLFLIRGFRNAGLQHCSGNLQPAALLLASCAKVTTDESRGRLAFVSAPVTCSYTNSPFSILHIRPFLRIDSNFQKPS